MALKQATISFGTLLMLATQFAASAEEGLKEPQTGQYNYDWFKGARIDFDFFLGFGPHVFGLPDELVVRYAESLELDDPAKYTFLRTNRTINQKELAEIAKSKGVNKDWRHVAFQNVFVEAIRPESLITTYSSPPVPIRVEFERLFWDCQSPVNNKLTISGVERSIMVVFYFDNKHEFQLDRSCYKYAGHKYSTQVHLVSGFASVQKINNEMFVIIGNVISKYDGYEFLRYLQNQPDIFVADYDKAIKFYRKHFFNAPRGEIPFEYADRKLYEFLKDENNRWKGPPP